MQVGSIAANFNYRKPYLVAACNGAVKRATQETLNGQMSHSPTVKFIATTMRLDTGHIWRLARGVRPHEGKKPKSVLALLIKSNNK